MPEHEGGVTVLRYYSAIFGSALCVAGACAAGCGAIWMFLKGGHYVYGEQISMLLATSAIALGLFYVFIMAPLRRRLRDEYEYNENGASKKHSFSRLTGAERAAIEKEKLINLEMVLSTPTLKRMTHAGSSDPEADLRGLVGIEDVKTCVTEMKARMIYEKKNRSVKRMSSMHMIFYGPPGTGKTTVARIAAGLLYRYGYIKNNRCIECDGNFLRGVTSSVGTAKTTALINAAKGGVLFIDEAYALLDKGEQGQEILATLVKAMEDDRGSLVIIFAGYEDEMKRFMNANPGIDSRIRHHLHFSTYSTEELREILIRMAGEQGFVISGEFAAEFDMHMANARKLVNFGNARAVRNLLDKAIDRHAVNAVGKPRKMIKEQMRTLSGEDFPEMYSDRI